MNLAPVKSQLSAFVVANMGRLTALTISKVNQILNEALLKLLNTCPPPEVLEQLAIVVNAVRPVVTTAERELDKARKIAEVLEPAIIAGDLIIQILTYNPKPVVIGTIAVEGTPTLIYAPTTGKVNRTAAKLMWFGNFVGMLRDEGLAIAQVVRSTAGVFAPVVNALNQIDALIQACLTNQDLSDEERKRIIDSIQSKLAANAEILGTPYKSQKSGNTYTIKIVTDPSSPAIAPRRQAIVQDFRGITVLTGPASFASNPQVLIEEIKFRIENQLP
jgi:hypothetical protein